MKHTKSLRPNISASDEKAFLKELAHRLRRHLPKVDSLMRLSDEPKNTETGGNKIRFAKGKNILLELWFDQYAQYPRKTLWYGYRWQSKRMFYAAFSNWKECVADRSHCIGNSGYTSRRGVWHLKQTLRRSQFTQPYLELYREPYEYFFGKFDCRNRASSNLISDIEDFFRKTLTPMGTIHVANVLSKKIKTVSEASETERVVKALRLMSRNEGIARAAKKRDHYKCNICRFDFASTYPGLGNDFAECHHTKPLSRRGRAKMVVTKIEELITVCSNCHRMLHKAEGQVQEDPEKFVRRIISSAAQRK